MFAYDFFLEKKTLIYLIYCSWMNRRRIKGEKREMKKVRKIVEKE